MLSCKPTMLVATVGTFQPQGEGRRISWPFPNPYPPTLRPGGQPPTPQSAQPPPSVTGRWEVWKGIRERYRAREVSSPPYILWAPLSGPAAPLSLRPRLLWRTPPSTPHLGFWQHDCFPSLALWASRKQQLPAATNFSTTLWVPLTPVHLQKSPFVQIRTTGYLLP